MVGYKKSFVRVMIIVVYIVIIALIISGISIIYGYLNTGADRSSILHTELLKNKQYTPKFIWSPLENEGRYMDEENLKSIEEDYLDAWYVKHLAYKTNTTEGINDFYTDNARANLFEFISSNTAKNITVESTTLEHHPTLEFFSEDGQLAVITDRNVKEYKRIFKDDELKFESLETSTYKIVLLLEDGFWRIRHMVKIVSKLKETNVININTRNLEISGINYYPKDTPWDMFGASFSEYIISSDFKIIKDSGLNTIRVFLQYEDFGKANVKPDKLNKLDKVLDIAESTGLNVVVTLFDFYGDYSVLDWSLNMKHAETIVSTFKNHEAIIAWDIKNEPNLDFDTRGKHNVISWLENMLNHVKSIDKLHPVTIGWSNIESTSILKDEVDFITFHYYENLNQLEDNINVLVERNPDKTIVMGEFGISSYNGFWYPFGNSQQDQANYHKKAQEIIAKTKIQYMSWTLYDFTQIPNEVVGRLPWRKHAQKRYGFIDENGTKKESFKYISGQ